MNLRPLAGAGILAFSLCQARPAAIIVCHDYAFFRITGIDPTPVLDTRAQATSVSDLRRVLTSRNYTSFKYGQAAAADPDKAGRLLKPGDVLILGDDHSGVVNDQGTIDHFIQVFGKSGARYDVWKLPDRSPTGEKLGGLHRHDTLRDFLARGFVIRPGASLQVWRKAPTGK